MNDCHAACPINFIAGRKYDIKPVAINDLNESKTVETVTLQEAADVKGGPHFASLGGRGLDFTASGDVAGFIAPGDVAGFTAPGDVASVKNAK